MAVALNNSASPASPVSPASPAPPSPRSMLTSILSHMEMDPCKQDAWLDGCLARARHGDASSLLRTFKETEKDQVGGFIDNPITQESFNTVSAPPQAGKTQGILLFAVEGAYDSSILPVMGVINSVLETARFREAAKKLNGVLLRVCGAIGIRPEDTPQLRIFDEGSAITYGIALSAWARGSSGSNVVPVFVVMMNNTKFNKFQVDHLPAIARAVGRDGEGRPKIMLVVDEADLQYKTENNTSQLEKSIFARKVTLGADHYDSLHGAFTTITNVTATPQALALGDVKFGGRNPVVYEPQPSKNNFQYHTKAGWRNKRITRAVAGSVEEMYRSMTADPANRFALMYEAKNCKVVGRSTAALDAAKRLKDAEGLVTFAWSSGKIEAFTPDPFWVNVFVTAAPGVFTRKALGAGAAGVSGFVGTKSVSSYPAVISYMARRGGASARCKFVLFACEMAARAVPIKGLDHEWGLTDMWIDAPSMPQEARIQVCGRLCGIDVVGEVKTLWCTEEEHAAHTAAIDTTQYIIDRLLREGIGARDAIAKTKKTLVDLTDDDDVPVVSKIIVDEDGAIGHLGGTKICRPSAGKRVRESAVGVKREIRERKLTLKTDRYDSALVHSEVPAQGAGAGAGAGADADAGADAGAGADADAGAGADADASPAMAVDDPSTLAEMRETIDNCGADVARAMKTVIRAPENDGGGGGGGGVEFRRMALEMASQNEYPDGLGFSPLKFLRFIVREAPGVLESNGIKLADGRFSEI